MAKSIILSISNNITFTPIYVRGRTALLTNLCRITQLSVDKKTDLLRWTTGSTDEAARRTLVRRCLRCQQAEYSYHRTRGEKVSGRSKLGIPAVNHLNSGPTSPYLYMINLSKLVLQSEVFSFPKIFLYIILFEKTE